MKDVKRLKLAENSHLIMLFLVSILFLAFSAYIVNACNSANPAIDVVKTANPTSLPAGGGSVTYTYEVTNPGNVPLSNVILTDDKLGIITVPTGDDGDNILATTETWTYTSNTNLTANTTNVATVTGDYNAQTVQATDDETVTVNPPQANVCPLNDSIPNRTIIHLNDSVASPGKGLRSDKIDPSYSFYGPISASIFAGNYDITFVSYDDHLSKLHQTQLNEQWYMELYGNLGLLLAKTNSITDLPDDEEWKTETVNYNLNISEDITSFSVFHSEYANIPTIGEPNSINPICVAFDKINSANPAIDVVKTANPTSLPAGGGSVTYTYEVTNPGNVPLSNVILTDDKLGIITVPTGDDGDNILATTETWTYTSNTNLTANTTNVATVTGDYNAQTVQATDDETVTVNPPQANPAIDVVKTANPTSLPAGGGSVTYTYEVTNPGNVPLSNVILTDDKLGIITVPTGDDGDNILATTETWTYTSNTNLTANTTNVATVTGDYNAQTVQATDDETVTVSGGGGGGFYPAIRIIKTPEPRALPLGGGEVVYTYLVTNPGYYTLSDVNLVDDKCTKIEFKEGDGNANDKLDRGEIWKYTCQSHLTETTINTVVVTGKSVRGNVTDTTKATVNVPTTDLAIDLEKTADPESLPEEGGLVVYRYEVFNKGVKAISDVTLTDNKCAQVTFTGGDINSDNKLDPTEVWTYTCESNITETTTNIGTVKGQVDGIYATDTSSAIVRVERVKGIIPKEMPKTGYGNSAIATGYNWQQFLFVVFILLSTTVFGSRFKRKLQ